MKNIILVLALGLGMTVASAEDIFRIQIGREQSADNAELSRRVFYLERAVWQMQQRVYNLEASNRPVQADSWLCTITAMGDSFTGTGGSKAVATERAIQQCKNKRGDGFFCTDAKCSNN